MSISLYIYIYICVYTFMYWYRYMYSICIGVCIYLESINKQCGASLEDVCGREGRRIGTFGTKQLETNPSG